MLSDILDVSEAQARILRAIAHYEAKSGIKGATQYSCTKKVPNGLHVSGATFNDNIKDLEEKQMVRRLKEINRGDRETKPFTITDIGQVAWLKYNTLTKNIDQETWLRHNTITKNIEIIQKIFPNIQFSAIDDIINQIEHPAMKNIKDGYSKRILEITLDSFNIENSNLPTSAYMQKYARETIELSGHSDLLKMSFSRYYKMRNYATVNKVIKKEGPFSEFDRNYDELEIKIIDRMTFLFYYNLIHSVIEQAFTRKVIFSVSTKERTMQEIKELLELSHLIIKKKKEIMKLINTNEEVRNIIQNNLNDLSKYKDKNFQDISNMFIKN